MAVTIKMHVTLPTPLPGCPYCGMVDSDPATHLSAGRCGDDAAGPEDWDDEPSPPSAKDRRVESRVMGWA